MAYYVFPANVFIQIATTTWEGSTNNTGEENNFNSRFLRSSFILASDTIVGKSTAIVVETVTFVASVVQNYKTWTN